MTVVPVTQSITGRSIADVGVLYIYQGSGISYTLKALTEASRGVVMSEAEHIVATGIVSNVYSLGYKKFYEQIGVSSESYERKRQASKNVFYMFCKETFRAKKFY